MKWARTIPTASRSTKHKDAQGHPLDGIPFHPYYTVKDLVGVCGFLLLFCGVIFFAPTFGGLFLESPNFEPANALQTPPHIAPVWYFTPFYAMLRAVPSFAGTQVWGVMVMGASIVVLFFVPWLDRSPVHSIRYRGPIYKVMLTIFVGVIHHIGNLRLEAAGGHLPDAGQNLHGLVLCFLFADALVHEIRQREAGAGKGHGTCLNAAY